LSQQRATLVRGRTQRCSSPRLVALARAIVYEPTVILFDEPLSNLEAQLREQMRVEVTRLRREVGITSIYVTHDQAEALAMSHRVVVMNNGVIRRSAIPLRSTSAPRTRSWPISSASPT
jgi:ABC-type Fe3+/spermidine/putrescine transport system ATPase subunit